MTNTTRPSTFSFSMHLLLSVWALVSVCALVLTGSPYAHAQTYSIIYSFNTSEGGNYPLAGVTLDRGGNLYGTTSQGGFGIGCQGGCGTVYKLTRRGSNWLFAPLYNFRGGSDGARPFARVVFGPDGSLYGTTYEAGIGCSGGCGVVFNLRPPPHQPSTPLPSWTETVLHLFSGDNDGGYPGSGDLIFDQAGNIYGTTSSGGGGFCPGLGCGTVYELARSNGGWTESVIHSFAQSGDAQEPFGGLVFDPSGNLYGDTLGGGTFNKGAVFEMTPSGSGWTEQVLYSFQGPPDGEGLYGTPILDLAGNLYATASLGGPRGGGTAFELTHSGNWALSLMHSFTGGQGNQGPQAGLIMDAAGNLYGTTNQQGAYGYGSVFKLSPSNGGWTYTSLHDFCIGGTTCTDGANPTGILAMDAQGNLYGTTTQGGVNNAGVVFEITP